MEKDADGYGEAVGDLLVVGDAEGFLVGISFGCETDGDADGYEETGAEIFLVGASVRYGETDGDEKG